MGKKVFNYKEALQELEEIVKRIENEECSIDELSKQVKRAAVLLSACQQKLRDTEKDVDDILGKLEKQ